ncbi:FAD-binding oxidoreductase [Arthrobacter sp. PsM3]|uniref:FAD-binding oxidoreductase n=1 Tax=Arthrobacter sp. PsM3 TaxID=3030531 RepID=UPI00263A9D32|nr:FAD-binding oxidoreductase [Arthrobacter sp. PsM3]MDN4645324.1 FAD-binding oxidoreductase [Arthrobacter sp. PsM3]
MKWITPVDPGYDESRTLFNAMIDRRPAVIAPCSTPAEVAGALRHAKDNHLAVAIRAGGHSVAGMSMNDGGLVVDVRPMKSARVDPEARTVTAGAGLTCGEFDRATQEHGLALTGGRVSTTGLAGFTLGGGSGWLERAFGFACDDLISVDLVTADGDQVTASATENPELFWALHGGGGNFGVATSFTFGLHRLGPTVHAGLMLWPGDAAAEVSRGYRELALAAPNEESATMAFLTAPPEPFVPPEMVGKMAAGVVYVYAGDTAEGAEHAKPYRALGPAVELLGDTSYADFQCSLDDPPGKYNYWSADYHNELSDDALDVIIDSARNLPGPSSQQLLVHWGGAVGGAGAATTPLLNRNASWVTHPFGLGDTPQCGQDARTWVKRFRQNISPYATGGVWLNFIGDEGQERVRSAFGEENYNRLARVKREFDPENIFRGNQNILPAAS